MSQSSIRIRSDSAWRVPEGVYGNGPSHPLASDGSHGPLEEGIGTVKGALMKRERISARRSLFIRHLYLFCNGIHPFLREIPIRGTCTLLGNVTPTLRPWVAEKSGLKVMKCVSTKSRVPGPFVTRVPHSKGGAEMVGFRSVRRPTS